MNVATIRKRARSFPFLGPRPANPFSVRTSSVLITNEAQVTRNQFQSITINVTPGAKTRIETLEGREHVVVPAVMMVEGVHNGSSGPILYPWEELSKTPEIWNQKPVVVYHPKGSACDPDVVNNRKIGVIMNAKADSKGKRLPAEAWLERSRADAVDKRIFTAIDNNEMMELSTGVFVDAELTPGEWNGEDYVAIARNMRSDHLALLPDKIGACSIKDGAGLLRNELKDGKMPKEKMLQRLMSWLHIDNEMSHENIRQALQAALRTKLSVGTDGPWVWVEAVYENFFVYDDGKSKLFRLGYSSSDAGVSLSDETPVEVIRVTEFRTVDGAKFVGNQDQTTTNSDMNKTQMIAAILAANIGWSESKALEGLSDKQIESIHNGLPKKETPAPGATTNQTPAPAPATPAAAATPATVTSNATATPVTLEEWERTAPPAVVAVFKALQNNQAAEEAALIAKIVENKELGWTEAELKGTPIANLRKMAKQAEAPAVHNYNGFTPAFQPPAPDYSGMAPAASVTNAGGAPAAIKPLGRPVMNFRKEEKGKGAAAAAV